MEEKSGFGYFLLGLGNRRGSRPAMGTENR